MSLIGLRTKGEARQHVRETITNELVKKLKTRYNHPDVHNKDAKIIGMPGYERSLKGDYLGV